jgi:altronate dehydratase small subunit
MNLAVVISSRDNVATALEPLEPGATIRVADTLLTIRDRIPRGHKVALCKIRRGEKILKYGSVIGTASLDIESGSHVHTHNLASARGRGDLAAAGSGADAAPGSPEPQHRPPV